MNLCVGGRTALCAVRLCRVRNTMPWSRTVVWPPNSTPYKSWTRARLLQALAPLDGLAEVIGDAAIDVCVPSPDCRIQVRGVTNIVSAPAWFKSPLVRVNDSFSFATPELLLAHLAAHDSLVTTALVAYELCGAYAYDPTTCQVVYGLRSACTVDDLQRFIDEMPGRIRGRKRLAEAAGYVRDNSWSPMESVLALVLCLPPTEGGYGMGDITLNRSVQNEDADGERIPDILFGSTHVGINYEGEGHFGTQNLTQVAHLAAAKGSTDSFDMVEAAGRDVRARIVRDKRRDRDLIFANYKVVTVTREDLYSTSVLDRLVWQVAKLVAKERDVKAPTLSEIAGDGEVRARRRELLRQMLHR